MFGYTGDDLTVFSFLIALAVTPLAEGIKSRGTERWLWWSPAILLTLSAFCWGAIKRTIPETSAHITTLATSLQTWFSVAILLLIVLVIHREKNRPMARDMRVGLGREAVTLATEIDGRLQQAQLGLMLGVSIEDFPAKILSMQLRFEKESITVPRLEHPINATDLRSYAHYFRMVGTLLKDGHFTEAKTMASQMAPTLLSGG
jgi:hypothetical protein